MLKTSVVKSPMVLVLGVALLSAVFAFQNCGGGFKSSSKLSSSDSPVEDATLTFKAGDLFDYSHVPMKSQMVRAMLNDWTYPPPSEGGKFFGAIAVAKDGTGYLSSYQA